MTSSPVPQPSRLDPPMAPLSKKVIAWVAAGIAIATAVLVVVLWWAGTKGLTGDKLVTARFEALRTGLSIGLAGGGLFVLYLAWRRQHSTEIGLAQKQQDQADVARAYELQRETFETTRQHQERVAAATERDAEARRITDLYTKAADQLGSEKAPVRLAGLYALERLAQDHVEQRQTIVNVLCAYLRMPHLDPGAPPSHDADDTTLTTYRERVQEREVRLAAQRILTTHLRPGADPAQQLDTFWADIDLDLTGATLINLDLDRCTARDASFSQANFTGAARFNGATFTGVAEFSEATFTGVAEFRGAIFGGVAKFDRATFVHDAKFDQAAFAGNAKFERATFAQDAAFDRATFAGAAEFNHGTFTVLAWFGEAAFTGTAGFREVTFAGDAVFSGATFTGTATFASASFTKYVEFRKAALPSTRYTGFRTRSPWTDFTVARFAQAVPSEVQRFVSPPDQNAVEYE